MIFSPREMADLADRARPLYERLRQAARRGGQQGDEPAASAVLERWCRITADGDWPTFEKRLRWDGIDLPRARSMLRDDVQQPSELPEWSHTLNAMLAAVGSDAWDRTANRFLDGERPCPFEDVLVPFVSYAGRQLAARMGATYDLFAGHAHAAAERALLKNLSNICGRALLAAFAERRTLRSENEPAQSNRSTLYRQFVAELLDGKLAAFFSEYSVLGRLAATVVACWIDATSELMARLNADRDAIRGHFNVPDDLGQVVSLVPDLSDPHDGRRFVVALTFANGFRVVYKPRDLRLEHAFNQLLGWLNARGLAPAMKTLTVLTRPDYGWVEFADQSPCEGDDAARSYFTRMGTLLCLGYLVDGVDLHYENIMTCGAHPVVVDAETFFYPKPRLATEAKAGTQALAVAREQVQWSVLKTGMLPETRAAANGVYYDVSAMGNRAQLLPGRRLEWQDVNTDTMRYDMVAVVQPARPGVPPATNHLDDLVGGFEQTYRFVLDHREELLAEQGPLSSFASLPVRFLVRPTRTYAVLLQNGYQPRYLRNGTDRGIALDAMSIGFLRTSDQPYLWPALQAEHRALERLDVPRFTTTTDGSWLATSRQERIDECFPVTGYVRALTRLRQLDDEDMYRQISFIRGSFLGLTGNGHAAGNRSRLDVEANSVDASHELAAESALAECRRIAALLDSLAIRSDDGTASWIGLACILQTSQASVRQLPMGLHDGVSGVALFLAAVDRITGQSEYADLARAGLRPVQHTVRDTRLLERAYKYVGIGGGFGVGSVVYALVVTSLLLDDPELIDDAARAASFISAARVHDDDTLDVLMGSAGAMLGLLKLYSVTRDAAVLEQARMCARHILSRQIQSGEQCGGWPGLNPRSLSGFSHGAAGIAYALTKLHEVTGEAELIRAARAAIDFERHLFVPEAGNWLPTDEPADRGVGLRATWCHGAAGIALSRLGMLGTVSDDRLREDLDVALQTTAAHAVDNVDHLCCGNFGRADVLFTAGQQLGRPDLVNTGMRNAGQVLARAQRVGGWAIDEAGGPNRNGFFQGRAGIGYALLRMTHPDTLPAVLMWQ